MLNRPQEAVFVGHALLLTQDTTVFGAHHRHPDVHTWRPAPFRASQAPMLTLSRHALIVDDAGESKYLAGRGRLMRMLLADNAIQGLLTIAEGKVFRLPFPHRCC